MLVEKTVQDVKAIWLVVMLMSLASQALHSALQHHRLSNVKLFVQQIQLLMQRPKYESISACCDAVRR